MKITLGLQFNQHTHHVAAGAFIHGNTVESWLHEINSWEMDMNRLSAICIPENSSSNMPAGLFVLFNNITHPDISRLIRHPYRLLGGKLFIPFNAALTPVISDTELPQLLIWDWQIFHPSLGFIGFEKKDVLSLSALLLYTPPRNTDWEYARIGITPTAKLKYIGIEKQEEETFAAVEKSIGNKKLEELISKEEEVQPVEENSTFVNIVTKLLAKILPGKYVQQFLQRRITKNNDDVEVKRRRELEKLIKMFDTDKDIALQYAIPLNSPYEKRGVSAQKGTELQRKDAFFTSKGLNDNAPADSWKVDDFYSELRDKYQQAAEDALTAKDYDRAAYVYAHLLGDYQTATNLLEQGGYYREAAAMYTTHLHNQPAAANCLEKGGLLLEAIEIYESLNQYEKSGDLYTQLDQPENAALLYNKSAQIAASNNDMLKAALIMLEKLHQKEQARSFLLDGWNRQAKPIECLQQYFGLSEADLKQQVPDIYKNHTTTSQQTNLLRVLNKIADKEEIKDITIDIMYDIVSQQTLTGNMENLWALKTFIPEDPLLPIDSNRFVNNTKTETIIKAAAPSFKFAADVKWLSGTMLKGQALLIGIKDNSVYLLHFNMINHWEYNLWTNLWTTAIDNNIQFTLVSDGRFHNRLLIHSNPEMLLENKVMEKRTSHDGFMHEVMVGGANWLPKGLLGICFTEKDVVTIHVASGVLVFSHYTPDGILQRARDCKLNGETLQVDANMHIVVQEIIYRHQHFFFSIGQYLVKSDKAGNLEMNDMGYHIYQLSPSSSHTVLRMAVASSGGTFIALFAGSHLKSKSNMFTHDGTPGTRVQYLSDNFVLVYAETLVQVFKASGEKVTTYCKIATDTAVSTILQMPQPAHIAVFEQGGKMNIHHLKNYNHGSNIAPVPDLSA
ncbi:hypothetical protein CLV51_103636 [Chitinophaga niastensis]|uniref:MoxR-vWA-beta-propeller ternary system domain-containing protein n=1 Tax=Chitinophaga niastensis TaxID=536980 RepID=A0A2P8HKA8_CHINA|nr:hypothetical protein [Chitinophaga niastensis]PSL46655.1 hypothetical protein CLV51_103636 [Chitinophaga niastensis]